MGCCCWFLFYSLSFQCALLWFHCGSLVCLSLSIQFDCLMHILWLPLPAPRHSYSVVWWLIWVIAMVVILHIYHSQGVQGFMFQPVLHTHCMSASCQQPSASCSAYLVTEEVINLSISSDFSNLKWWSDQDPSAISSHGGTERWEIQWLAESASNLVAHSPRVSAQCQGY